MTGNRFNEVEKFFKKKSGEKGNQEKSRLKLNPVSVKPISLPSSDAWSSGPKSFRV